MPAVMNFAPRNFQLSANLCRTEVYPVDPAGGAISLANLPATLLYEDDAVADYLLFFSRTEHSSDVLEFLLSFRDFQRERERNILALDEQHTRSLLVDLLVRHVEDGCKHPVGLSSDVTVELRTWLDTFKTAPTAKDKVALALPSEALSSAVEQCLRDLKTDILPRFLKSDLGSELSMLHPAACLAHSTGRDAINKMGLDDLQRSAVEFWRDAHALAVSTGSPDDKITMAQQIHERFGPKLPLFNVPLAECEAIDEEIRSGGAWSPIELYLSAQTAAINVLYQANFPAFLASAGAKEYLATVGSDTMKFDKSHMPPAPEAGEDAYHAEW